MSYNIKFVTLDSFALLVSCLRQSSTIHNTHFCEKLHLPQELLSFIISTSWNAMPYDSCFQSLTHLWSPVHITVLWRWGQSSEALFLCTPSSSFIAQALTPCLADAQIQWVFRLCLKHWCFGWHWQPEGPSRPHPSRNMREHEAGFSAAQL